MKIVWAVFEKMKILNFFLMWTSLNFEGRSKTRKEAGDICKGTLDIEFERDWSVSLGATFGEGQKIKNYFSSFRDFPGKADSVILLEFECTINSQNLIKIVGAISEKIKMFIFFSCELPLILALGGKLKKKKSSRYLQENPRYRIWTRSVNWFRLYDRRRTDRQTHIHIDIF